MENIMKKLKLLLATFMVFGLVGCSSGSSDTQTKENQAKENEVTENKSEDIQYASMLPNEKEYFKNGEITTIDADGGKQYAFRVENYQDGEYEAYIEKCKEMGFNTDVNEGKNDGGKWFNAYTSDKEYYLSVMLGNEIEAIDISCKTATKK